MSTPQNDAHQSGQESSTAMSKTRVTGFLRRKGFLYTAGTFCALFLLFGALGYFWLPGFAKGKLEALLSEEFARPVRVERIEISPYSLSATITGFSIGAKAEGEEPLFAFDSLYVNLSAASIARRIPVVSAVRLKGPRVALTRKADGTYSITDLIDKWTAPTPKPEPKDSEPFRFSVADISIEGGKAIFDDQQAGARHEVTDLTLAVPFIANTEGEVQSNVQPKFSAKVNGSPLHLEGTVKPFAPGQDAAMEIVVDGFDLMKLVRYAPPGLPMALESAMLSTRLKVAFTRPQGKDAALKLSGETTLTNVSLARTLPGGGKAGVRLAKANLRLDEATLDGKVRCALTLSDLGVSSGGKKPVLGFAGLETVGVDVSTSARKATVDEVKLVKPFAAARRLKGGEIDLATLLSGLAAPAQGAKAAPQPAKPATPDAKQPAGKGAKAADKPGAWAWQVKRIAVSEGGLTFADETLGRKPRQITASGLSLNVDGLSGAPGSKAAVDFSTRINEQGGIKVNGTAQLSPLAADLTLALTEVDLVALQGWATAELGAVLTRGEVSTNGRLVLAGDDASYSGDVNLVDFSVLDKINASDLLSWRSLKLTKLAAGSSPPRVDVGKVAINGLFAKVLLTPEGRLNLHDVMSQERAKEAQQARDAAKAGGKPAVKTAEKPEAAPAKPEAAPATAKPGPAPQIRIGAITLAGGNVNFTDRFVKPNYTANLTDLNGRVGALKAGTLTDVALRGKVDRTGALDISGKADPLGPALNLDIHAKATGIEMSGFSPYSGRYVGYAIEKGKLSVDLRYLVDKGNLKAENNVFLDQLTFGKKVDSPDALSIPVNLVVALLKNSRGEIDINLPIQGSLDDPQFSIGGVIVKVIMNLLVKAATSPFTLLASLFGGGEELSNVAFDPGQAVISPEAEKQLETLSKALRDRPGLKLELAGHTDPQVEQDGLRRAWLDHRVKAQKATALARRGQATGSVAEVVVTPEEYPGYLARVYKAADFKKPRNIVGLAKSLPVEEMEALLLANAETGTAELERLAQDRGIAVQAWLVEKGGVDPARVFLLAPRVDSEAPKGVAPGGRVDFSLR